MIVLQAAWLALFAAHAAGDGSAPSQWVAATHITAVGEPDLVGFAIWRDLSLAGLLHALGAGQLGALRLRRLMMLLENCSALRRLWRKASAWASR